MSTSNYYNDIKTTCKAKKKKFCLEPVSYTHLDVYKRQRTPIARHVHRDYATHVYEDVRVGFLGRAEFDSSNF